MKTTSTFAVSYNSGLFFPIIFYFVHGQTRSVKTETLNRQNKLPISLGKPGLHWIIFANVGVACRAGFKS